MDTVADYTAWKSKQQQDSVGAAQVVLGSIDGKPDEVAGDLNLANDFGKTTGNPVPPLPMVQEYRGVFQQEIERQKNNTILSSAPRLTEWLRNPENAAVSRDDLQGLSWWETALGAGKNSLSRGVQRLPQSYNQFLAIEAAQRSEDKSKSFGDLYADERAKPMFDWGYLGNSGLIDTAVGPITDLVSAGSRFAMSRLSGAVGTNEKQAAQNFQVTAGEWAKRIDAIPMSPAGERYKKSFQSMKPTGDMKADLGEFMQSAAADPGGFLSFLTETAVESAPAIAAALGATVATRSPTVGATVMGGYSGVVEAGTAPIEFFQEHGIDVSTPQGALAAINNPKMMQDAKDRGLTRGVIIGVMDGLSGGVAGKQLAASPLGNMVLQAVTQAAFGAGGEAAGQIASGQDFDIRQVALEGLAEFVTAPVEVAAMGGEKFFEGRAKARDAQARVAMFQELSGQAQNSALRARMPDKFRQFVEAATANGPVENVYVPADQFTQYFQGIGVDPHALVDELEGVTRDDLDAALAGGGDLQIPTATYAAKIAGSEHDAFLMENMRFDPDQFTAREAADFNAHAQDAMEEAWTVAEDLRQHEETFRSFEQEIYDTMVSRLRTAGRSTDVATTEAMLFPAFYRVMAERSGMTTDEFMQRYPLPQVQGSVPEGMQLRDVDSLNRTLAEARSRKTTRDSRQSLLEFISEYGGINDPGGELRARDAETIKGGKGKKTLKLARSGVLAGVKDMFGGTGKKHGVDDVARAAIEAGFMADDPIANEYTAAQNEGREVPDITRPLWAAIDRELGGERQFSSQQQADPAATENEALDSIEQYLSGLGVSLDDDDATIKQAMQKDQEEQGRRYGQFAGPQSESADLHQLSRAKEMISDRRSSELVRRETGWFRGSDGRWRYEISDDAASLDLGLMPDLGPKAVSGEVVLLGDLLRHDKLYAAYPDLKATPIIFDTSMEAHGFVNGAGTEIGMNPRALKDTDAFLSTLLHEVQHLIQRREGFARGGTLSVAQQVRPVLNELANYKERVAEDWKKANKALLDDAERASMVNGYVQLYASFEQLMRYANSDRPSSVLRHISGNTGWFYSPYIQENDALRARANDLQRQFYAMPKRHRLRDRNLFLSQMAFDMAQLFRDAVPTEIWTEFQNDERQMKSMEKAFEREASKAREKLKPLQEREAASRRAKEVVEATKFKSPFEIYRALAGEVEARNTQARAKMTDAERRESSPLQTADVDPSQTIVVFQDGEVEAPFMANLGNVPANGPRLLFQSAGPGARGSIQFPQAGVGNGDTVVRLFETADLSTMLHESGHYFLTVMQDLAGRGETGASSDMSVVRSWWRENAADVAADAMRVMPDVTITADDVIAALDRGTTGDVMKDGAIDVGMQEQWARGFETYLMEGKAPSADLRSAFEKFRSWLISVYRRMAGLNVKVSDDIRRVFDRMLASDQEIAKAQAQAGSTSPVFSTAEEMGLTPEQYESFLKLRSQAEEDSKARLLREVMAPIKREQEKWFKEERSKVRDEVETEVNGYRYYRAIEWMGNRRWLGEGKPESMPDFRMSKDVLVDRYGEGVLKTLPRGKHTVYTLEGGLDPDDAAGWFGFGSGDEMVRAMEQAPKRSEAIDAETDRIMRERHGDVLNDGAIEAQALDAVHIDKRGQWIAAELKAIVEIAETGKGLTAKEARSSARQTISRMRVRDAMNVNRFLAAERKAADEAGRLGAMLARDGIWLQAADRRMKSKARAASRGDANTEQVNATIDRRNSILESGDVNYQVDDRTITTKAGQQRTIQGGPRTSHIAGYNENIAKLIDAKRRQLLNHAFYMEARKVADEVEKAENFVAKLSKPTTRERIAGAGRRENAQVDYLGAIDELLERYDFRRLSGAAEQRRGALAAFVAAMTAAGRENELAIPETVLADAASKPYKMLPVEELRGVVESLKNLEHVATRWNKLIDSQQQRALDEVVTDIVVAFDANVKKRPPGRVSTRAEALRNTGRQFLDLVLNATTLLREIDGFKDMGATYRNLKSPIDDAASRLITRKEKAAADLEALYDVYTKDERRRMAVREHMPELGYALSKWERIAVALNMGNDGNRQRLTDPKVRGSLNEGQVASVLATLDERDAKFVQSVWDYVGTFKEDIAARERRSTGVEPDWVEAVPINIGGKTLSGGYYPIKYDPRLSSLARDDETQDISKSLQAGRFGKAQTRQGHLKERAQSSGRDVELDMSVLHRHINQVIYDLELSEPVANAWRILQDGRVREKFTEAGKQADFDALEMWLKDVAEGELRSADFVGRAARVLKSNFTASKLAFNLVTVAMQVTGGVQSMVVVGKKDFAIGVKNSFRPGVADEIVAKSPYMKTRQTTFNKDIYDFYSDPKTGPTASRWGDIKKEFIGPMSFWLMTKTQWLIVDIPTWLAGYHQGLRQFDGDEAKAISHADDIVKRAQASGLFSDRSAIERGSVTRTARQNDVVRLFTALGSYMFAKFNVAYERTAKAGRTIGEEGVSTKSAGEALSWTMDMIFLFMVEAVVTAAIKGQLPRDDDEKNDSWAKFLAKQTAFNVMGTIPFIRDVASPLQGFDGGGAYGSITKEVATPFLQAAQGDVDAAFIKSVINGTGLVTGAPATQINRVVDSAWRQSEGQDVSPLEYILGRIKK